MKQQRKVKIADVPTTKGKIIVRTELSYDHGGANVFGDSKQRGYYLYAFPTEDLGANIIVVHLFSGAVRMIEEAKGFSPKRLAALAATIKEHPLYEPLFNQVVAKNNLTIAPETKAA